MRRPDMYVIIENKLLIIEIDEYSHKKSSYIRDTSIRNNELMEDLFYKDVVIIRFNPDSYMKNGKSYKSCFIKKENKYIVADENELQKRINKLSSVIRTMLSKKEWLSFDIIKLFYGD
jgi:hypothetical protein